MQVASESKHGMKGLSLEQVEGLLLSCIGGLLDGPRPEPSLSPSIDLLDWGRFSALTRLHGLSPLLTYLNKKDLISPQFPESLLEQWAKDYRWSAYHNMLLQGHLRSVLSAFRDHGIPVIVLKGAALAERLYPQIGLRPMKDIDILVRQSDVHHAQGILETAGFEGPKSQALEDLFMLHHHHMAPRLHRSTGAMIELHWQLARPDRPYRLDMPEMWANAHEVSLAGVPCWSLDPIDQLIHLCIHYLGDRLGKQTGGLLQLLDIALFLRMYGDAISWPEFIDRAIRYQVGSEVFTALYICRLVLGASYPAEVATTLRPSQFDESKIEPFIVHRVIGRGCDLPTSLINALASPGWSAKLLALIQMLRAPEPWIPGVGVSKTNRLSPVRSIFSLPARSIAAVRAVASQIRQVRGQLVAERWIAQFDDGRTHVGLKKSHQ